MVTNFARFFALLLAHEKSGITMRCTQVAESGVLTIENLSPRLGDRGRSSAHSILNRASMEWHAFGTLHQWTNPRSLKYDVLQMPLLRTRRSEGLFADSDLRNLSTVLDGADGCNR